MPSPSDVRSGGYLSHVIFSATRFSRDAFIEWRPNYLSSLFIGATLVFSLYHWSRPIPSGLTTARAISPLVGVAVAGVALIVLGQWAARKSSFQYLKIGRVSLLLLLLGAIVVAVIASVRGVSQGMPVNRLTVWSLPAIIVLLLVKPLGHLEVWTALRAWTLTLSLAILIDCLYIGPTLARYGEKEETANFRLPLLETLLPIDGRWTGPFVNLHNAGFMGVWLVIFALVDRSRLGLLFLPVGLTAILISDSRAAWIGAALGVAAYSFISIKKLRIPILMVMVGLIFVTIRLSPTGNGRLEIMQFHVGLAIMNPITGSEVARIGHAHNSFLDVFSRYGALAGMFFLTAAALTLWLAMRQRSRWQARVMPLLAVTFCAYLLDTAVYLEYFSPEWIALIGLMLLVLSSTNSVVSVSQSRKLTPRL